MTFKTTKLRDAITFALVAGATSVAGTGIAFAQDQDQDQESTASETTTLDRIEVTGSRLKRAEIEGAMPVTIIDRAQIDASGEVSVADYLRTTNFNSVGQFRPQSGSSAQAGAFADLRGLGGQRSEEHTSELPSLMRNSYAAFCLKKKTIIEHKNKIK